MNFHKLNVANLIRETDDALTISFDVPRQILDLFHYKSGQYLTINIPIIDGFQRRAYSISSSPSNNDNIAITVKEIDNGTVSVYLNNKLKIGDELEVMPPMGNFIRENYDDNKYIVLYAGGSGITPLFSILQSSLAESSSKILLLYSNKSADSIIFYKKLQELETKFADRLKIIYTISANDDNWTGRRGRFDDMYITNILNEHISSDISNSIHFLCGPQGLINEVEKALITLPIQSGNIKKELFTTPLNKLPVDENISKSSVAEITKRSVKVKLYGEIHQIEVEPDDTLVTALQKNGAEPPFSCQIGACSTCRAKVVSGSVIMDECEALTDDEINNGLILSCQAHPTSDDCFIDFDNCN